MKSFFWKEKVEKWLSIGNLDQFLPEISALQGVPQPDKFHAEGDVFTHTLLAVDAVPPSSDERIFWAVLLHDIGKSTTTKKIDGRLRTWGHEKVGAEIVPNILQRFNLLHIAEDVSWLVKHHGFMLSWGKDLTALTKKQMRFCGHPLFTLLVQVATADGKASIGSSDKLERLNKILSLYNVELSSGS